MSSPTILSTNLKQHSTEALKCHLQEILTAQAGYSLKQRVDSADHALTPIFQELRLRNPLPQPEDQVPVMLGTWTPIWTTIPYQDILPGRIKNQSYQIFHDDGFYANIARYAPGHSKLWQQISNLLVALDLMVIQKFAVRNHEWDIQNIAIKQTLRCRTQTLTPQRADDWFTEVVARLSRQPETQTIDRSIDKSTTKKLQTAFQAQPKFEHLYIDNDFRLVKTRRDNKQRCSYTLVTRRLQNPSISSSH